MRHNDTGNTNKHIKWFRNHLTLHTTKPSQFTLMCNKREVSLTQSKSTFRSNDFYYDFLIIGAFVKNSGRLRNLV